MYKLLIVDDEPLTREYFTTQLSSLNDKWICAGEAGDGREALELLEKGEMFDLVITDIKMPLMNGLELAQVISERGIKTKVVIISGYDEFSLAQKAIHYGVNDYLLKPLVREELCYVLDNTAARLEQERSELAAYQSLISLSEETRSHAAKNFLRALVAENDTEIKALHPLLYRMKISLIEAEGAIMIIELDEGGLMQRDIPYAEFVLFRYIVHQAAAEIAQTEPGAIVFFDDAQQILLLVPGEDADDAASRCSRLYDQLSDAVFNMTGIQIWGAVGTSQIDVLQLISSYRNADRAMKSRLFIPDPKLIFFTADYYPFAARLLELEKEISSLQGAVIHSNDSSIYASTYSIIEMTALPMLDKRRLLLLGHYLLKRLSASIEISNDGRLQQAIATMRQLNSCSTLTHESVTELFSRMLILLVKSDSPSGNEHEIVTKAKSYIYSHFAKPLSLALIAEHIGVTPGYLSSLFHLQVGESYIKFLTRVRMEHAAKLLRSKPVEKVYDVSEKVGYVSVKHFSYVFKQHFGMPPGEYQDKE